jgi:probable rRNA maturation factor
VSVDIANESGTEVDEAALAGIARHVLGELHIHPLAELSVLLVDEKVMADLHERWMGEPGPADVLAFPMDELRPPGPPHLGGARGDRTSADGEDDSPSALLGDVVLCPQVAAEQAREAKHSVGDELELLCTHGLLHLLGYDHAEPEERATMFGLQTELLASYRAAHGRTPATSDPATSDPATSGARGSAATASAATASAATASAATASAATGHTAKGSGSKGRKGAE